MAIMDTSILNTYKPITLEEMSAVRLMNRVDMKFVTSISNLESLLRLLSKEYYVQDTDGLRLFPYHTMYFDTPSHRMYMLHQSGKKVRQKIRMREYINSHMNFLEIKRKNNKGRTKKKRIQIDGFSTKTDKFEDFITAHSDYHSDELIPHLENNFNRITLVNHAFTERLTIDVGLKFHNMLNGRIEELPNITVIELKRDGMKPSPALKHLNSLRIKASGFSKYCMGMVFTSSDLKANRFKAQRRYVEKINSQSNCQP